MAIASLLHLPDPGTLGRAAFNFEHAMAHRSVLGAMAPLSRFSALPYLIDPMQDEGVPGSKWHMDHQQAHNDARGSLSSDQILRDSNLDNENQRLWWTFINHQEHHLQMGALFPPTPWTYPFW